MAKKKSFKSQAASVFFENPEPPQPEEKTTAKAAAKPKKNPSKLDSAEKDVYTHTYTHMEKSAGEATDAKANPRRGGSASAHKTTAPLAQLMPLQREMKTRRVQLLLRPSTHKAIQSMAKTQGTSLNDLVNAVLEEYIRKREL